jgi:C-terminal processing protease CtpA/Prc
MKLIRRIICGAATAAMLATPAAGRAEGTNPTPDFKEVYDLIKSHLAGASDAELNRAAVQGLLKELHTKVSLVSGKSETNRPDEGPVLTQSNLFDNSIACLRVGRVGNGLAEKISSTYKQFSASNHMKGVVLDLRFADGHNYSEVASVAGLFVSDEAPLLNWGNGMVRSKENADAITLPVAVLVNQHTAAAAEALAAVLRKSAHAMILGATTAGEATVGKEFPLKNGQELRIATAAVKLADGEALSANGLKPDIEVSVKPDDEKAWFTDPYKETSTASELLAKLNGTSGTNTTNHARTRTTEADLMRLRKEQPGVDLDFAISSAAPDETPEKPVIRDPVLGRALDLIKGISVIRQAHSP